MAAPTWEELKKMSDEEVAATYDGMTASGITGFGFWLDELARREQTKATDTQIKASEVMVKQTDTMLEYTRKIWWMTVVVTGATLVNVVIALVLIFK
jgi:hypothetical protein